MVIMGVLVDFGPFNFISEAPQCLELIFLSEVVDDGMALAKGQICLCIYDGWDFFHWVDALICLGEMLS